MSALDDCHTLAAVLYAGQTCDVLTRSWCSPPAALVCDSDDTSPDAGALLSATGPTPEAAAEALAVALRAKATARARELLRAAGEPQPTDRGVRGGARLDDAALRCAVIHVLRARGLDLGSAEIVMRGVVTAIREAERRADERHEPVEGVAQRVVRHVVAEGRFGSEARYTGWSTVEGAVATVAAAMVRHAPIAANRSVRLVLEVLPEDDGAASHGHSVAPSAGERQSRGEVSP